MINSQLTSNFHLTPEETLFSLCTSIVEKTLSPWSVQIKWHKGSGEKDLLFRGLIRWHSDNGVEGKEWSSAVVVGSRPNLFFSRPHQKKSPAKASAEVSLSCSFFSLVISPQHTFSPAGRARERERVRWQNLEFFLSSPHERQRQKFSPCPSFKAG